MIHETASKRSEKARKAYHRPELTVHGDVEKITGWWGGPYGEWLAGQGQDWNPWSSTCHS